MKVRLKDNRDFLAGLMFIVVGCGAMFMARDYPFGSALRMGPGYFPTVLGGLVTLGGIIVLIEGFVKQVHIGRTWSVRALIILPLSALVFGVLMEHAGFVPAVFVLCIVAALASPEFHWKEQLILAAGLTLGCVSLFIWGLGLPYPLFAGH
jgi:putative tricarboxylic transport membrane protein